MLADGEISSSGMAATAVYKYRVVEAVPRAAAHPPVALQAAAQVAVVTSVIRPHNASKSMAIKRPIVKTVKAIIASACAVIHRAVIWAAHRQAVVLRAVQVHLPAVAAAANAIILQIAVPYMTAIFKPVGR